MNEETVQPKKMGSWKRGWLITKSAWHVLKLDKELLVLPLVSSIIGLVLVVAGYGGGLLLSNKGNSISKWSFDTQHMSHATYAVWIITSALLALLSSYTIAAMVAMSLKRLRGGDPVLRDGARAVKSHFGALSGFTLVSFTIVSVLQRLESYLPFAGKILAFLGELAWRAGSFFSVPVIVDADGYVGPIDATKQSVGLIRKTWKESTVNTFTMGSIFLVLVLMDAVIGAAITALAAISVGAVLAVFTGILAGIVLLALILISSAMEGIAKAVLYYYAVTGEAPAQFDKRLLQEAFTPKKARKIFA